MEEIIYLNLESLKEKAVYPRHTFPLYSYSKDKESSQLPIYPVGNMFSIWLPDYNGLLVFPLLPYCLFSILFSGSFNQSFLLSLTNNHFFSDIIQCLQHMHDSQVDMSRLKLSTGFQIHIFNYQFNFPSLDATQFCHVQNQIPHFPKSCSSHRLLHLSDHSILLLSQTLLALQLLPSSIPKAPANSQPETDFISSHLNAVGLSAIISHLYYINSLLCPFFTQISKQ